MASDLQGLNLKFCVWRTFSSHSSLHPQEVLLAQCSQYVHRSGLKLDSFHYICNSELGKTVSVLVSVLSYNIANLKYGVEDMLFRCSHKVIYPVSKNNISRKKKKYDSAV